MRLAKDGEKGMSTGKVGENESVESALRRFKRKCSRDGIIGDLRKKEFYEKPSVKRKKKSEAARKRSKVHKIVGFFLCKFCRKDTKNNRL